MRSNYINSTSGRKYLTENGFSDIDFLYDVKFKFQTEAKIGTLKPGFKPMLRLTLRLKFKT